MIHYCPRCGRIALELRINLCLTCRKKEGYMKCKGCGDHVPLISGKCAECVRNQMYSGPAYDVEVSITRAGRVRAVVPSLDGCAVEAESEQSARTGLEKAIHERTGRFPSRLYRMIRAVNAGGVPA